MPWEAGKKLNAKPFTIEKELKIGGFGITYLAKDESGNLVVIKIPKWDISNISDKNEIKEIKRSFREEALKLHELSKELKSPHIVQFKEIFQEGTWDLPCIVMEYIEGVTLEQLVNKHLEETQQPLDEDIALQYIEQIGQALITIHNSNLLHRDINPGNIMIRTATNEAVLIDFGLARKFIPAQKLEQTTVLLTSGYAPPEQYIKSTITGEFSDVYALAATLYYLLTAKVPIDAFERTRGKYLEEPQEINPKISKEINNAILKGMDLKEDNRPKTVQEWLTEIKEKKLKNENLVSPDISETGVADFGYDLYNYYYYTEDSPNTDADENLPCPYRGLFHFSPNDAEFFFGREVFVEELFNATKTYNFIPVLGASGSGKSSVVLAGLVPKLQNEGHWLFTHFRPDSDPFHALALALVPLYNPNLDHVNTIIQARKLSKALGEGEIPLADVFAQIHQNHPTHRVLLIADQFEEIYTLCTDQKIRHRFLDTLLANFPSSLFQSHYKCVLIVTMRADFLGNALSYQPFGDVLLNTDIKIRPMNYKELEQVIVKPSEKLGVTFEEGLVKRILDDVESEPGTLPLLEFALTELWQRRNRKQLTHVAYEKMGEVKGVLSCYADAKYYNLRDEDKEKVRRIFIQLVRLGEGTEDTRRLATKAELGEASWGLVKELADARLVVTSRNAEDQETVEVVHEALIRNWSQLRQWMQTDRSFRAWQDRLRIAIYQWKQTQRDEGALLRGVLLVDAEEKLKQRREDLSEEEQEFIQASLELRGIEQEEQDMRNRPWWRKIIG
jgi:serine/threonine protein kinase